MMKTRKGYPVYPLTVAQKFHLYYLPFCPNAAVLNIGTSLTIGTDLDRDVLRESIYKAYERNEGMRIRFAKDKEGNVYQYVVSAEQDRQEREIEFVDFSNVTIILCRMMETHMCGQQIRRTVWKNVKWN